MNEAIGTSYGNVNELIRALAAYATPTLRGRILGVTSSGRRKTITMTKENFDKIKEDLASGAKNKAEIARERGISPTQVTKVERGGYDAKYGGGEIPEPASKPAVDVEETEPSAEEEEPVAAVDQAELSIPDLAPKQEELAMPEPIADPFPAEPEQASELGSPAFGSEGVEVAPTNIPEEGVEGELESFDEPVSDTPEQLVSEEPLPTLGDGSSMPPPLEPTIPMAQPSPPPSPFEPVTETDTTPLEEAPIMEGIPQGDLHPSPEEGAPQAPLEDTLRPSDSDQTSPRLNKGKFSADLTRPPISRSSDEG